MEFRELEAFLVLAEELHFGRAGERLYVSQSRVSQLLRSLEGRIGAPLLERTSRRAELTPLGEKFLAELRPAYGALQAAVDHARATVRGVAGVLRVGFQGVIDDHLATAIAGFEERHPGCAVDLTEIPLADPFGALRRREVDAAVVLLPVEEPDLTLGPVFSRQPQVLAVSPRHPFADKEFVTAEELAGCPLIGVHGSAPEYWRRAQAPGTTPGGHRIPRGPTAGTLQEGMGLAAAGRGAMLLCRSTAEHQGQRASVVFVPVTGLPESVLGVVWRTEHHTGAAHAFAEEIAVAERQA
ncbi:LysR family transcriptional regulator [Amycolatopsis magusensis]|uniref:DNA-binding transcriptional LysR family regulator n=1 Tax=Amycolatopsis magusensis TaxID=882444 RepID=A0ABS4Q3B9_9PSEU|nr:LysR family transcriptional regulator [Amycolatopsis magusensis]MBP2185615.1 DNA-binding transcriptional LysR family regulator [Amycolatopsis magusensis]